jgi:hypothetical protein
MGNEVIGGRLRVKAELRQNFPERFVSISYDHGPMAIGVGVSMLTHEDGVT